MQYKLIFTTGRGKRKEFPLFEGANTVGRSDKNSFRIISDAISRRHAEIKVRGERVRIKDLNSSNGIYVNGERVRQADLKAGDLVKIGPAKFILERSEADSGAPRLAPGNDSDESLDISHMQLDDDPNLGVSQQIQDLLNGPTIEDEPRE